MPRKPKGTLLRDTLKTLEDATWNNCQRDIIDSGDAYLAVGIDMAADESNWGLSVLSLDSSLKSANLRLFLPFKHRSRWIRPSREKIKALFDGLFKASQITIVVAVDVPFGWPQKQACFLQAWFAVWPSDNLAVLQSPDEFKYRLCDHEMRRLFENNGLSNALYSVAADKIASAAYTWCTARAGLMCSNNVDVGYYSQANTKIRFFETYPSAYVRLNYPDCAAYKTTKELIGNDGSSTGSNQTEKQQKQLRHRLIKAIRRDYAIEMDNTLQQQIDAACSTKASDAFDGFLSAISAWDYLKWRHGTGPAPIMTCPANLLGQRRALQEMARIMREGWILVKCRQGIEFK